MSNMIKLQKIKLDPVSVEIFSHYESSKQVLFLWEDSQHGTYLYSDVVTISGNNGAFSALNKPITFFSDGVIFKVIDIETHELLFSHTIYNLSFIKGTKVLYVSQNNHTGYGFAARNCIYQLLCQGYEVQWESAVFGEEQNRYVPSNEYELMVDECRNKKIDYDCVIIHNIPSGFELAINSLGLNESKPIYGSTVWETTLIHPDWVNLINAKVDAIIIPSKFNENVFSDSGVDVPIHLWKYDIFPIEKREPKYDVVSKFMTYNGSSFEKDHDGIMNALTNTTVYYNISQYTTRKNIDQTLRTFCSVFTSDSSVCLILKLFVKDFQNREQEYLKYKIKSILSQFRNPPTIILCVDDLNTSEIEEIHRMGDVYYTLNKGEGFGLCTYTAKKFGNKVICGGFGSEIEIVDSQDCIVPFKKERPYGMINYHNYYDSLGQQWASFKNEDAIEALKKLKP